MIVYGISNEFQGELGSRSCLMSPESDLAEVHGQQTLGMSPVTSALA